VKNLANGGKTVCAHAASYGTATLTISARHTKKLTLRAYPGETVALPELSLGVDNMRIEGFDFSKGGITTAQQKSRNLEIVGNRFHDGLFSALFVWSGDSNITFERNRVWNLSHRGGWTQGYGVSARADGTVTGLHIRYNTFDNLENDALEIGGTDGGEIIGNVIKRVVVPPAPTANPHPDSLMLWAGSKNFLIKDNRFSDGHGLLMSGSTSDVRLENNLIVRMKNYCHDGGTTGSSSAGLVRYTWIRNTIYDCGSYWGGGGFGGSYGLLSDGPATAGASNRVERNVLTSLQPETASQFAYEDYNVVVNGTRGGGHDIGTRPTFADQVDYQPTNLPAGYGDVGYKPAPAGADARLP
jgi:hypothetical protein